VLKRNKKRSGNEWSQKQRETVGLTPVVAGGKHSLIRRTGANVPYLSSLVQKDILINDVILIIKVNDVDLKEKHREERCVEDEAEKYKMHLLPLPPTAVQSSIRSSDSPEKKRVPSFNMTVISKQESLCSFFLSRLLHKTKGFQLDWP